MPRENTTKAENGSSTHLGDICIVDISYMGQGCEKSRPWLTHTLMAAEVLSVDAVTLAKLSVELTCLCEGC